MAYDHNYEYRKWTLEFKSSFIQYMKRDEAVRFIEHFKYNPLPYYIGLDASVSGIDTFGNLIDMFRTSTTLRKLHLGGCGYLELEKVAELIAANSNLKFLICNIDHRQVDEPDIGVIADALRSNSTLKHLHISAYSRLGDDKVRTIIEALEDNISLKSIKIRSLDRDIASWENVFIRILRRNSTLETISLLQDIRIELSILLERNRVNRRLRKFGLLWQLLEKGVLENRE